MRIVGAVAVAAVTLLAGCSSAPAETLPQGSLSPGSAEVSINGAGIGSTDDVNCSSGGTVTTIDTGDDEAGTTSAIDTAEAPTVQFAEIRNLGGFTGSYWAELDQEAEVTVTGRTFLMTGTANGFTDSNPSQRISQSFSIRVAC